MGQRQFAAKEIIFREGEPGDYAYVIESGHVEILKHGQDGEVQLAVLGPGSVFGEMALFDYDETRSATARCVDEVNVLEELSAEDFQMLLARCPGELLPFLRSLIARMRDLNKRVVSTERATVLLDDAINHLHVAPGSETLRGAFEPMSLEAANLPFKIGGYMVGEDSKQLNHLDIICNKEPLMVSYEHCIIERTEEGVFVRDLGSRFCTSVNGKYIGRAKVSNKAPLFPGENTIVLGDHTSEYILLITCK